MNTTLRQRQQIEIDFWRTSPTERPEANAIEILIGKMGDAEILLDLVQRYHPLLAGARTIVEFGAGQGWGSCLVKRLFPHAHVTATDISEHAIASVHKWERVFDVRLDRSLACVSYAVPLPDASVDLVFCFAAAHHFVAHRRTLREIHRLLVPGGQCLYLYEPSCRRFLHAAAVRRVNRKRPEVPEDVLVFPTLQAIARNVGLIAEVDFYPSVRRRGPKELLYYSLLRHSPVLQRMLPCTANFHFTRPAS